MKNKTLLTKIDAFMIGISKWMSYLAAGCLIFIMCLAFFDAMFSKFLRRSIPRATELVTYLNVAIVFLGLAIVQLKDKHTTVELTYGKYPPAIKKMCCIVANFAGTAVCAYFGKLGFEYAVEMFLKGNLSGAMNGFPLWPFAAIMGIGWVMLALTSLWTVVRLVFNMIPLPGTEEEAFMEATRHLPIDAPSAPKKGGVDQ